MGNFPCQQTVVTYLVSPHGTGLWLFFLETLFLETEFIRGRERDRQTERDRKRERSLNDHRAWVSLKPGAGNTVQVLMRVARL